MRCHKLNQRQIPATASILAATLLLALAAPAGAEDICGDISGDGLVNSGDLGILLAAFGRPDHYDPNADLDSDGDVDQADLAWFQTGRFLYELGLPGPCAPYGTGTMELRLDAVDNTSVGPGDDAYSPEFDGGVTHFTFDLLAEVSADNDWTTQSSRVEILADGVQFFNHIYGSDIDPDDDWFFDLPAIEFDTFFAFPPVLFDHPDGGFADLADWTDASVDAVWFEDSDAAAFNDDYLATTQRLTLVIDADSGMAPAVLPDDCAHDFAVLATITADATCLATGANFLHREFVIVDLAQPICPGDIDGDGDVDQADLGILLSTYNRPPNDPQYNHHADLDCDGDVDQADLGTLLANYGEDC